ncbi:MAG: hypothetical protein ACLPV8_18545 [Steroidobacteraceae bacterium]
MSDEEQLRSRAARLFALALKTRDDGKPQLADEITRLASEALEHAKAMAPPMPPAQAPQQQPAQQQQQQQPQPKEDEK